MGQSNIGSISVFPGGMALRSCVMLLLYREYKCIPWWNGPQVICHVTFITLLWQFWAISRDRAS